ncbi:UNVERIFIED_CONTAM: hypothetical protein HDU68_004762 [Siphonaria sp. JEL0065]|nr:hypothetical protein HDU68_004762 [Siphonaria sp. JEL0065]
MGETASIAKSTESLLASRPRIPQQKHLRELSATESVKTLVDNEDEYLDNSFLKLSTSHTSTTEDSFTLEEIDSYSKSILSRAVIFSSMTFPQLQQIKQSEPLPIRAVHRGLWQQQELRSLILTSDPETIDLGISYKMDENSVLDDVLWDEDNESTPSDSRENPINAFKDTFMPTQDTETMDGSKSLVDLIKFPSKWNTMHCPPFRFGYEFSLEQLENMNKHPGSKIFSSQNFYAGSLWQLYIQKLDGVDGAALGIYMQRMAPDSAISENKRSSADISLYVDGRIQAKVWFQIVCYFADSCCVLESKPDLFKATQSWGWRSTKMYKDVFGGEDDEKSKGHKHVFKAVVIIGQT